MVYLLHFTRAYGHAQHYVGFCEEGNLERRLWEHRTGQGGKLLKIIKEHGIDFILARTWPNATRNKERQIKIVGHSSRYCPVCQGKQQAVGWGISGQYWSGDIIMLTD